MIGTYAKNSAAQQGKAAERAARIAAKRAEIADRLSKMAAK